MCAIVVSFNRRDLLARVLEGIEAQTTPADRIVVVDNGSTDGAVEMVTTDFPAVELLRARDNLGGAGGFTTGISWAMVHEFDAVWLMDDDAIPDSTCLEHLLAAAHRIPDAPFLAPRVLDEDGQTGPRNFPILEGDVPTIYADFAHGAFPIRAATFVGPFIHRWAIETTHLPLADFFIWHDDFEYTARLARIRPGVSVPGATIRHLAVTKGPSHYLADRNFYNVRNILWWKREAAETESPHRPQAGAALRGIALTQFRNAPRKSEFVRVYLKGLRVGLFSRPRRIPIDEASNYLAETVLPVPDPQR